MNLFSDVDVKKGLIAGAFGLAGTLIPAALSWSRERDAVSTRQRRIDEATKRIAFWDQWLKLSAQVDSSQGAVERVKKELAMLGQIIENDSLQAHNQIAKLQEKSNRFTQEVTVLPAWRRLLLLYKPERSLAWFPRLLFYSGVVAMVLFVAIQISELHQKDSSSAIGGLFIFEFMALVWCTIFRYLSRFLEQPHGPSVNDTTTVSPPPIPNR